MRDSWYDVAQICLNGHVVNSATKDRPAHNKKFCDRCGSQTFTTCSECNKDIQGKYHVAGVFSLSDSFSAPSFCSNCGKPYPWTLAKMQAAQDFSSELENISDEEKKILAQSIDDIVKDSPKTSLAVAKFKRILSKAGGPIVTTFKDIVVEIASETAKKALLQK